MIDDNVHNFLAAKAPSVKFDKFGDTITGRVLTAEVQQDRDFLSGNLLTWDNGDPRKVLIVTIATDLHDPKIDNDDGARRIWARSALAGAIKGAVARSGARFLPGGTLTITYTHDKEPTGPKKQYPSKQYTAEYQGPPAGFSAEQLPDDDEPF
jgi:hypothetical protein